jgi:hypothetical protein
MMTLQFARMSARRLLLACDPDLAMELVRG